MTWLLEIKKRLEAATPNFHSDERKDYLHDIAHLLEAIAVKDAALERAREVGVFEHEHKELQRGMNHFWSAVKADVYGALAFDPRQKDSVMEKEK